VTAPITPTVARFLLSELERLTKEEQGKLARDGDGNPPLAMSPRAEVNALARLLGMLDFAAGAS
jgi:hypothetical protein